MFQLVCVNHQPITMDLHEGFGFTFSLVSPYFKQTVGSPFGLLFLRLSNSVLRASLHSGKPGIHHRPYGNPGRLLTTSHFATFPDLKNFRLSFTEAIQQVHSLQRSLLPSAFCGCACPTPRFTHRHTVNLQHPFIHGFFFQRIFSLSEKQIYC